MRILPRLPLYCAAVATAAACTVLLTSAPASAEFDIPMVEADDRVPCVLPTDEQDSLTSKSWTLDFLALEEAHQYNRGTYDNGDAVKIAVIDSGVNAQLDIFGGRVVEGFDAWDGSTSGHCDSHHHGTGVAAIAAGGAEGRQFIGVAPEAQIMPIRIFQDTEGGDSAKSEILARSIDAAVANGADVINVSLVVVHTDNLQAAVARAIDAGVAVVAATGNDTKNMDALSETPTDEQTFYPANYPEVIAVGAHNQSGNWYEGTNFGTNLDLLAPGEGIAYPYAGGGWTNGAGTSFAAPQVSGAAALLKGYFGKDTEPAWIEQRLKDTAIHPPNDFNIYQGHGVLDVLDALTAPETDEPDGDESSPPPAPFEPQSLDPIPVNYDPLRTEKVIAWSSVGGSVALIILVLVLRKIIPQGHGRGWRPGTRGSDDRPATSAVEGL